MSATYFWKNGELHIESEQMLTQGAQARGLTDLYCVDAFETEPNWRYGIYTSLRGWRREDIANFPPEFRLALLLEGVT